MVKVIPYIAKFSLPKDFANRCQNGCKKCSQIKISRRRLYKVDIKAFSVLIAGAIASEIKQTKELHAVC